MDKPIPGSSEEFVELGGGTGGAFVLVKIGALARATADDDGIVDAPDVGPLAARPWKRDTLKVDLAIAECQAGHLIAAELGPEDVVGFAWRGIAFDSDRSVADALDAPGALGPPAIGVFQGGNFHTAHHDADIRGDETECADGFYGDDRRGLAVGLDRKDSGCIAAE